MEEKIKVPSENYSWLKKQLVMWQEKNILTEEQNGKIKDLYEPEIKTSKSERTITIISILGALLLGLGVILFFASNWRYIPYQFKLLLIIGFICTAYFTGYYIAYQKKNYPKVGDALIMLGTLFFGAGIWLVAQIFNIHYDSYSYQLIWAVGALLIALVINKDLNYTLSIILFSIYFILYKIYYYESINLIMFLIILFHLYLGTKNGLKTTIAFAILSGFIWTEATMITYLITSEYELTLTLFIIPLYYSLFAYCGARIYEKYKDSNESTKTIRIIGLFGILLSGFILTFSQLVNNMRNHWFGNIQLYVFNKATIFFGIVGILTLLSIIYSILINKESRNRVEGIFLTLICLIPTAYFVRWGLVNTGNTTTYGEILEFAVIIFNVVYACSIINFIQIGVYEKNERYINISLLFIAIFIIARYFDFGWSLLGKSGFFMIGGIILIVVAVFIERLRRRMLKEMRVTDYEE